jgi:nucleotide-binding universal stress UspA family protein
MYKRILVAFDGSEPSQRALAEAIKVAKDGHAELHVLHVVDEFLVGSTPDASHMSTTYYAEAIQALQASGRQILEQARDTAGSAGLVIETTLEETIGSRVADLIVAKAKEWEADLIVMGTHGRRGLRRLVLGSDAEWVLRSTPVPVLFVRAADDEEADATPTGRQPSSAA